MPDEFDFSARRDERAKDEQQLAEAGAAYHKRRIERVQEFAAAISAAHPTINVAVSEELITLMVGASKLAIRPSNIGWRVTEAATFFQKLEDLFLGHDISTKYTIDAIDRWVSRQK
jgi:hypothetical protein